MGRDLTDLVVPLPPFDQDEIQVSEKIDEAQKKAEKAAKEAAKKEQRTAKLGKAKSLPESIADQTENVNEPSVPSEDLRQELIPMIEPADQAKAETEGYSPEESRIQQALGFLGPKKIEKIISTLRKFENRDNGRLHKRVIQLKNDLEEWDKRVKDAQREYGDPKFQRNTLDKPPFATDVSVESYPRLFRLLDTLFRLMEGFGEAVTDDCKIHIADDTVSFEVTEAKDKVDHVLTKKEAKALVEYNDAIKRSSYAHKPHIRKYDYIFNGTFKIALASGSNKDTVERKIEDDIVDLVILFYKSYDAIRKSRIAQEEQARVRAEQERRRQLLREQRQNELAKVRRLLNAVDDHKTAEDIRAYVKALIDVKAVVDEEVIEWMLKKADWIDPVTDQEDERLGTIDHTADQEDKLWFFKYY